MTGEAGRCAAKPTTSQVAAPRLVAGLTVVLTVACAAPYRVSVRRAPLFELVGIRAIAVEPCVQEGCEGLRSALLTELVDSETYDVLERGRSAQVETLNVGDLRVRFVTTLLDGPPAADAELLIDVTQNAATPAAGAQGGKSAGLHRTVVRVGATLTVVETTMRAILVRRSLSTLEEGTAYGAGRAPNDAVLAKRAWRTIAREFVRTIAPWEEVVEFDRVGVGVCPALPAGVGSLERGDLLSAASVFAGCVALYPADAAALYHLGIVAASDGDVARAESLFGRAAALDGEAAYTRAINAMRRERARLERAAKNTGSMEKRR